MIAKLSNSFFKKFRSRTKQLIAASDCRTKTNNVASNPRIVDQLAPNVPQRMVKKARCQ